MSQLSMANRIRELYAAGQRVTLRRYARADGERIATQLSPIVSQLLSDGCALVEEIAARFASTGIRVASDPGPGGIAAAAVRLREHERRLLAHSSAGDPQRMIADCGAALHVLQYSLQEAEPPVCRLENVSPELPTPLEVSLAVRKHYRSLWDLHAKHGTPSERNARTLLRSLGTRLAILAGSDVVPLLREDDQVLLRELQAGVLEWLGADQGVDAAREIWQRLGQLVMQLRLVGKRQELREHDRRVMSAAMAELAAHGEEALPHVLATLRPVLGCDDALDEVISSHPSARSLSHELQRSLGALHPGL